MKFILATKKFIKWDLEFVFLKDLMQKMTSDTFFKAYEQLEDSTWEEDYDEMFGWDTWATDLKLYNESKEMIFGEQRINLELVEELLPNN